MAGALSSVSNILSRDEDALLAEWLREQATAGGRAAALAATGEQREASREFLMTLRDGVTQGADDVDGAAYAPVRQLLAALSRTRAGQGFTPTETATFIFSLKRPLFTRLRQEFRGDAEGLAGAVWDVTQIVDRLGLHTMELFQKSREDIINRQQLEMTELSTPVVKLWDGILALPVIGTLDSQRTQIVMETLLQRIVEVEAEVAIIDITGVPMVDTLVAQHLLKTVTAARLMGADCIISGIRPQIAQTIVHLGVDLQGVSTKATLADAFLLALQRTGRLGAVTAARR